MPGFDRKAKLARRLFSGVTNEYDSLLWLLTFAMDRHWRRTIVKRSGIDSGTKVLDIATGTGLLAFDLAKCAGSDGKVVGLDLTMNMLRKAKAVREKRGHPQRVEFVTGRAEHLPFRADTFECATISLGLRNVSNVRETFEEMRCVVRSGGSVISLDFTRPPNRLLRKIYYFYLLKVLPIIGRLVSAEWHDIFEYLGRSILEFYPVEEVEAIMKQAGLQNIERHSLTGGVVTFFIGTK